MFSGCFRHESIQFLVKVYSVLEFIQWSWGRQQNTGNLILLYGILLHVANINMWGLNFLPKPILIAVEIDVRLKQRSTLKFLFDICQLLPFVCSCSIRITRATATLHLLRIRHNSVIVALSRGGLYQTHRQWLVIVIQREKQLWSRFSW